MTNKSGHWTCRLTHTPLSSPLPPVTSGECESNWTIPATTTGWLAIKMVKCRTSGGEEGGCGWTTSWDSPREQWVGCKLLVMIKCVLLSYWGCPILPATAGRVMCDSWEAVKAVCVFCPNPPSLLWVPTWSKLSNSDQVSQTAPTTPHRHLTINSLSRN